jgi:hypothetical protein
MTQWIKDSFEISTDKSKLNPKVIFQFLKESYWANDQPRRMSFKPTKNQQVTFNAKKISSSCNVVQYNLKHET